jgi:hypothetical protein
LNRVLSAPSRCVGRKGETTRATATRPQRPAIDARHRRSAAPRLYSWALVGVAVLVLLFAFFGSRSAPIPERPSGAPGSAPPRRASSTGRVSVPTSVPTSNRGPGPTGGNVPRTIDATGKSDVTVALNAYFSRVPDGTTVVFPTHSRYRIEGTLTLEQHKNVVVDGNGAVFFAATNGSNRAAPGCDRGASVCRYPNRTRAHWSLVNDTNVSVRNVNVVGSNPDPGPRGTYEPKLEAQQAFEILGGTRIVLDHVTAHDVWGDLVYVGRSQSGRTATSPTFVTVQNSTFYGASRQGWSVTNGQHITFVNNTLYSARRSLIDIESNSKSDEISYLTVRNNRFGSYRLCTFTNYGAASVEHDFVFADNHMIGGSPIRICIQAKSVARRRNFAITGNVSSSGPTPNSPMVSIAFVDHVTVSGNVQRFAASAWPRRGGMNGSPQAPVTSTCSSVVVTGNVFTPRPAGMPESVAKPC